LRVPKQYLRMQPNSCLLPLCHGTICFPLDSFVSKMLIHEVKVTITVTVAISADFMFLELLITKSAITFNSVHPEVHICHIRTNRQPDGRLKQSTASGK